MKNILKLTAVTLLISQAFLSAMANDDPKVVPDVVYKNTEHGPMHLDLYYPAAPEPGSKYPLVVYIHGGGWSAGNRQMGDRGKKRDLVDGLNAAGFCVASIEYRLCKMEGIKMRDCVIDSKDAIRYLAKNAKKLSLDADRICSMGDSAGGHLAQMVLLTPPDSFVGDPALADAVYRMVGGVSWYGPCDFEKIDLFRRDDGKAVKDRFGNRIVSGDLTPEQKLAAYREVSPVNYLRADMPPLLMMQGDKDPTIPVYHTYYMKERADAVNAPVEMYIVRNARHGWNEVDGTMQPSLEEIIAKTVSFMVKAIKN